MFRYGDINHESTPEGQRAWVHVEGVDTNNKSDLRAAIWEALYEELSRLLCLANSNLIEELHRKNILEKMEFSREYPLTLKCLEELTFALDWRIQKKKFDDTRTNSQKDTVATTEVGDGSLFDGLPSNKILVFGD